MSASKHEREFMQRIGKYKAESHDEAGALHRALPLEERLLRSWQLYLAGREAASLDRRDDDPERFYEIARTRGLCPR